MRDLILRFFFTFTLTAIVFYAYASSDSLSLSVKRYDSTFTDKPYREPEYNTVSFTEGLLPTSSDPLDSAQCYINKVRAMAAKVRETENYISNLNDVSLFTLPAGIPRIIDGLNYDIINSPQSLPPRGLCRERSLRRVPSETLRRKKK